MTRQWARMVDRHGFHIPVEDLRTLKRIAARQDGMLLMALPQVSVDRLLHYQLVEESSRATDWAAGPGPRVCVTELGIEVLNER